MNRINGNDPVIFPCISVEQPIGAFYIGAMDAADLVAISWADIRRIAPGDEDSRPLRNESEPSLSIGNTPLSQTSIEALDEDAVPFEDQSFEEFLGIQRELNLGRVAEIQQYVKNVDATFPTAILLAVSSDHARYDESAKMLSIVRHSKAAKIIDGQHRIAGLKSYSGPKFQVNVAVFIDMDIQDQAMVFATINLKQTKVNKSLAYDLYEFTTTRSPQKTCHDIVRFLNNRRNSPLEGKITMLGVGRGPTETITQATFVDRLLRLVSRDPMEDRNLLRRKRPLARAQGAQARRQIFRNMFISDRDNTITAILWNFFLAVSGKWPQSWPVVEQGNILNRTTGFGALMRFLRVAYLSMETPDKIVLADQYQQILDRVSLPDGGFTPDKYLPGSSGEKALFDQLVEQSKLGAYT